MRANLAQRVLESSCPVHGIVPLVVSEPPRVPNFSVIFVDPRTDSGQCARVRISRVPFFIKTPKSGRGLKPYEALQLPPPDAEENRGS